MFKSCDHIYGDIYFIPQVLLSKIFQNSRIFFDCFFSLSEEFNGVLLLSIQSGLNDVEHKLFGIDILRRKDHLEVLQVFFDLFKLSFQLVLFFLEVLFHISQAFLLNLKHIYSIN